MASKWLLIEVFGGHEPSIIGLGSTPKRYTSLDHLIRNRDTLEAVTRTIGEVMETQSAIDRVSEDRRRRIIAVPLLTFTDRLHGIYLWSGSPDEDVPERRPAGAWFFNLTQSKASGSDDLLDLYGVPADERHSEKAMAGAFTRLVTNRDEGEAIAKIVQSAPGTEHQAVWTVRRDDDELRAAHFSCRMLEEFPNGTDRPEVILRGVTQDIGPSVDVPAAPPPVILEHRVLAATADDGEYRAIVNLKSLTLIRWIGEPMPGIAWESVDDQVTPALHPDDLPVAREMSDGLATRKTNGVMRFRALDGSWKTLTVKATLMMLDQHTTAGLVSLREPG